MLRLNKVPKPNSDIYLELVNGFEWAVMTYLDLSLLERGMERRTLGYRQ